MADRVEWDVEPGQVIDRAFVDARREELRGAAELRICVGAFDSMDTFRSVLVRSLRKLDISFFEVGADRHGLVGTDWPETNNALRELRDLARLEVLGLSWCYKINDHGCETLAELRGLKRLELESSMTDAGLGRLGALADLEGLWLTCCREFTGAGFAHWPDGGKLLWLDLSQSTGVGDEALQIVAKQTRLEVLRLNGCVRLTDAGFRSLAESEWLEELALFGVRMDVSTLRMLRDKFPKCVIDADAGLVTGASADEVADIASRRRG